MAESRMNRAIVRSGREEGQDRRHDQLVTHVCSEQATVSKEEDEKDERTQHFEVPHLRVVRLSRKASTQIIAKH